MFSKQQNPSTPKKGHFGIQRKENPPERVKAEVRRGVVSGSDLLLQSLSMVLKSADIGPSEVRTRACTVRMSCRQMDVFLLSLCNLRYNIAHRLISKSKQLPDWNVSSYSLFLSFLNLDWSVDQFNKQAIRQLIYCTCDSDSLCNLLRVQLTDCQREEQSNWMASE